MRLKSPIKMARLLLGSLMASPLLLNSSATADGATLTVDLSRPGPKVSPLLYGLFFEEINHAGDGGLYAELVRNRSFEDANMAEGWTPVTGGGGEVSLSLDTERPLNGQNPHALKLVIRSPDDARVGVANGGYWGLPVGNGKS
jgi:alpha-N-arabinofuranosidase